MKSIYNLKNIRENGDIILNKPSQLVSISRKDMSKMDMEIADIFLHVVQNFIFMNNIKKISELEKNKFEIKIQDLMDSLYPNGYDKIRDNNLQSKILSVQSINIITMDKHSFASSTIFTDVYYNQKPGYIQFKMNEDILDGMLREDKIINYDENKKILGEDNMPKAYFTSYNHIEVNNMGLSGIQRGIYEQILRYRDNIYNGEIDYDVWDFVELIGINSKDLVYIKKKIDISIRDINRLTRYNAKVKYEYYKRKIIRVKLKFKEK